MTKTKPDAAVIGSGVIGLTSAIRLLEAGFNVKIIAKDLPPNTTSNVAAALWHPGGVTGKREQTWCKLGLDVFKEFAKDKASGIKFVTLHELSDRAFEDEGLELSDDLNQADIGLFPEPWRYGYQFTTARIDVPSYMPFLVNQFEGLGGILNQRSVEDIDELSQNYDLIVNASGIGAKLLINDDAVYPIRGQVISVKKPEDLEDDIIHVHTEEIFTYIVPRENDCILGGTYQEHDDNLIMDEAIAEAILERTSQFITAFKKPEILAHKVGLRPGRQNVRLELETRNNTPIIHNYGHGSIGHTLAWGCAKDVANLAQGLFQPAFT